MTTLQNQEYEASHIKVLEGLEPVRQRPWMYIGSTDEKWLHHMVQEIIDNAVDEAIAGHCTSITVILNEDWSVTVHDNGRWIPVKIHEKTWKSALETVFTVLHAGWKFEKSAYKVSGWLHGVWSSVVNALSEWLEAKVFKHWEIYFQRYKRWVPEKDVEIIGTTEINWTSITFKPDHEVFDTVEFMSLVLLQRVKQAAYLTPWVIFTYIDKIQNNSTRFCFEWWIRTWLKSLVDNQMTLSSPHYINSEWENCWMEVAFQYVNTASVNDSVLSFTNNIPTKNWWTHVLWFKSALLTIINEVSKEKGKIHKKIWEFQYSDVLDWLYAIVCVRIPEPQFEWQTKWRLGNAYVRTEVERMCYDYIKKYFEENESEFDQMFEKIELAARARLAAKFAKETVLRKNVIAGWVLPWKLSDCANKKKEWTELYIVEWDSAWGTAKQGRDSGFQAILPLRGKILNTENASIQKIMANNEIKSLITAIWAWTRDNYDSETLRYEKIIIMTDADVDWAHIRTLLLTFFFRYMRNLIEDWNLFIACPPIYKFKQWKREEFIYDESISPAELWFEKDKTEIQRYKWLGEMNSDQLWSTTMNPETRKMFKVNIEDAEESDKLFRILMGEDVQSRKHFILTHAKTVKDIDI